MAKALGPSHVRTAAREQWGNVNSQKQVVPGVWAIDTWGHGGYLVAVGPNEPFQLAEALRVPKFEGASWSMLGTPVLTFYAFEEDCDWAVLLLAHEELRVAEDARGDFVDPMSLSVEYLRGVVERWNPDFLSVEGRVSDPNKATTVYITIRVVPRDTTQPITEAETSLLFEEERTQEQRRAVVENAARALYPRAAGVRIPTPVREGGRG